MTVLLAESVFRTINLSVTFIRVGRAHPLVIEAVVVAQTRHMLTVRATIIREDGDDRRGPCSAIAPAFQGRPKAAGRLGAERSVRVDGMSPARSPRPRSNSS